jgi:phosphoribosylamine--glycine ligase
MNVLIIGAGGREHAFAWKIAQSPKLTKLFIAPGNAGTAQCGTNVPLSETDFPAIRKFVLDNQIHLVVVGPETPLVLGIHDFFLDDAQLKSIPVIGPQKLGALLEGSKDFSKLFMQRHGIPTAAYRTFTHDTLKDGLHFLETLQAPYVLKADGLAGGKGVVIPTTLVEAKMELHDMLAHAKFGKASAKVVIEEFLQGIELSVFVLTDGNSYKILPSAKDYKRIGEQDTGLNTGGMGAISPVPFLDAALMEKIEKDIVIPTIEGLKKDKIPYKGFIFIGLMNCAGNNPYVIEYNVRMGDPETEVVVPRIKSDLLDLFENVGNGTLSEKTIEVDDQTAATVMLVSGGYPEAFEKGFEVVLNKEIAGSYVFHAGTQMENNKIITSGGRVMAVTSIGKNISAALKKSYETISKISFDKMYYRKDIGQDLIQ